jgi:hypothetical protein
MATLLLALPLVAACKKSEDKKAPAPAPQPAAAPVAAPAPPPVVTVTEGDSDLNGSYDGSKAIFINDNDMQLIVMPKDCPAFDCTSTDWTAYASDSMTKACPKANMLVISVGDHTHKNPLKVGATPAKIDIRIPGGGSMIAGPEIGDAGVALTAVGADAVAGTVDFKGALTMKGAFKAKVCPPPAPAQ